MKKSFLTLSLGVLGFVFPTYFLQAAVSDSLKSGVFQDILGKSGANIIQDNPEATLSAKFASALQLFLGALAVIMMVIVIYAGFLWLTAGGDSKKVDEAKNWIKNATIGIAIIGMAYLIVALVVNFFLAK